MHRSHPTYTPDSRVPIRKNPQRKQENPGIHDEPYPHGGTTPPWTYMERTHRPTPPPSPLHIEAEWSANDVPAQREWHDNMGVSMSGRGHRNPSGRRNLRHITELRRKGDMDGSAGDKEDQTDPQVRHARNRPSSLRDWRQLDDRIPLHRDKRIPNGKGHSSFEGSTK